MEVHVFHINIIDVYIRVRIPVLKLTAFFVEFMLCDLQPHLRSEGMV